MVWKVSKYFWNVSVRHFPEHITATDVVISRHNRNFNVLIELISRNGSWKQTAKDKSRLKNPSKKTWGNFIS